MPKKHLSSPLLPREFISKIESEPCMDGFRSRVYDEMSHVVRLDLRQWVQPSRPVFKCTANDPSFSEDSDRTCLHAFAMEGDVLVVAEQITLGTDPDPADKKGITPLQVVFQEMLDLRSSIPYYSFETGRLRTPAERHNLFLRLVLTARLLIEQHVKIDMSVDRASLLDVACRLERWDLIELLLQHGAKISPVTASYLKSRSDKKRLNELVNLYPGASRPPRACPCWSGKPLEECHGLKPQPYPLEYLCICGTGKIYRQCCYKRGQVILSVWDAEKKLLDHDFQRMHQIPVEFRKQLLQMQNEYGQMSEFSVAPGVSKVAIEKRQATAKILLKKGLIGPAFAYAMERAEFTALPTGRLYSGPIRENRQLMWNNLVDEYIATGKDLRPVEEIVRLAKVGRSCGALIRICEGKDCGKVETKDVKLNVCGSCKMACYCSRACQKSAWASHKSICGTEGQLEQMLPSQKAVNSFFQEMIDTANEMAEEES